MVCISISIGFLLIAVGGWLTWSNEANQVCSSEAYYDATDATKLITGEQCFLENDYNNQFTHRTCTVLKESLSTIETNTGIKADGAYKLTFLTEQYGYQKTSEKQLVDPRDEGSSAATTNGEEDCNCLQKVWTASPFNLGDSNIKFCRKCPKSKYDFPPDDSIWSDSPDAKLGFQVKYADHVPLGDGTIQIDQPDISMIKNPKLLLAPTTPENITSALLDYKRVDTKICGKVGNNLMCFKSISRRVNSASTLEFDKTAIGDIRMKVEAYGSTEITALGIQTPNSDGTVAFIKPGSFGESKFPPCQAREIYYLVDGKISAKETYEKFHTDLTIRTNILRVVSFFLIFGGLYCILSPIQEAPESIPLIGSFLSTIVGCVFYIICALVSIGLWFTITAWAWLFYRPILGAIFLILALFLNLAAFGVYRRKVRKVRKQESERSDEYPEVTMIPEATLMVEDVYGGPENFQDVEKVRNDNIFQRNGI